MQGRQSRYSSVDCAVTHTAIMIPIIVTTTDSASRLGNELCVTNNDTRSFEPNINDTKGIFLHIDFVFTYFTGT